MVALSLDIISFTTLIEIRPSFYFSKTLLKQRKSIYIFVCLCPLAISLCKYWHVSISKNCSYKFLKGAFFTRGKPNMFQSPEFTFLYLNQPIGLCKKRKEKKLFQANLGRVFFNSNRSNIWKVNFHIISCSANVVCRIYIKYFLELIQSHGPQYEPPISISC